MALIHRDISILSGTLNVTTGRNGFYAVQIIVNHVCKENHNIYGSFNVIQEKRNMIYDVKMFLLTEEQLLFWSFKRAQTDSSWYIRH